MNEIIHEDYIKTFYFDLLLTVHLSIFISVINQLYAQHFCFTIRLFNASTCFEHMCSKHVEELNKLTVKQKFCVSSCLITEMNHFLCRFIEEGKHVFSNF